MPVLQQRAHGCSRAVAACGPKQQARRTKAVLVTCKAHRFVGHQAAAADAGGTGGSSSSSNSSESTGYVQWPADTQQQQQQQQQHQQQQQEQAPQQQLQASEQRQQQPPPGYDPKAAAGFMPTPGEKPMWWVEEFETRRKRLAEKHASSSSSNNAAGVLADPQPASSSSSSSKSSGVAAWLPKAVLQLLQLAVVNAVLILWPASLHPGGLAAGNVWLAYWAYMLFFAGGSVYRLVTFGPLAARKKDAQGRTWWSTAAWLLFVVSVPVIHWPPVGAFLQRQQMLAVNAAAGGRGTLYGSVITAYDVLGTALLAAAVGLNWWAARTLGRAYDRVVAPDALVTSGPYSFVQHPIYSSYMLLFAGYALLMHSAPTALLAVGVCVVYYLSRTRLERAVLQQAFGQPYEEYRQRTKLFVPFVL